MLEATGPMLMKRIWTKWNKYDDEHDDEVLLAGKTLGSDAYSDANCIPIKRFKIIRNRQRHWLTGLHRRILTNSPPKKVHFTQPEVYFSDPEVYQPTIDDLQIPVMRKTCTSLPEEDRVKSEFTITQR